MHSANSRKLWICWKEARVCCRGMLLDLMTCARVWVRVASRGGQEVVLRMPEAAELQVCLVEVWGAVKGL
jgi:hypothetical protein